jgi:hypothetical protein
MSVLGLLSFFFLLFCYTVMKLSSKYAEMMCLAVFSFVFCCYMSAGRANGKRKQAEEERSWDPPSTRTSVIASGLGCDRTMAGKLRGAVIPTVWLEKIIKRDILASSQSCRTDVGVRFFKWQSRHELFQA